MSDYKEMVLIGGANDGRRIQANMRNMQAVMKQVIPRSKQAHGTDVGNVAFNTQREFVSDLEAYSLVSLSLGHERMDIYLHQGTPVKDVLKKLLEHYKP